MYVAHISPAAVAAAGRESSCGPQQSLNAIREPSSVPNAPIAKAASVGCSAAFDASEEPALAPPAESSPKPLSKCQAGGLDL